MNELDGALLRVLENQRVALSRAELEGILGRDSSAAQQVVRALKRLEAKGLVRVDGVTRARRYVATRPGKSESGNLGLSSQAEEALALMARPVHARVPSTYRRAWLDSYVPGQTRYLPLDQASRLSALGQTPAIHQPAGTWARHVLERFLLDLSWNSARLEGNTYSLLDTERLLKEGARAEGKTIVETQMLLNHKAAIEFVVAEPMTASIDERTVKTLHALLMENLLNDRMEEGRLRRAPVQIGGSAYLPLAHPQLIDECFRQVVLNAQRIEDPFECSLFLLVHLPYLQSFIDGNKRTARLAANLPFVLRNLIPLSFVDVPVDLFQKAYLAVYELNRLEPLRDLFVWAYERSAARLGQVRASLGEPDPFRLEYRQQLREVIAAVVRAQTAAPLVRSFIERFAEEHLPQHVRAKFIASAEVELEGLHEGTFARYGLRPSEFQRWQGTR